jgi:DNA processing protein
MPYDGVARVLRGEVGYPARLLEIHGSPSELWVSGALPRPGQPLLAIVGSRKASGAGCDRAHQLAAAFGARGWGIVSGGAFGIDAAAHEGALAAGAETWAVLGCGVDVIYPDRHAGLFARIARQGGLVSELTPGTPPKKSHFPSRNRIIAGLADVVVVVEAAYRSGALITAGFARKGGRRLFAVPGTSGTDALLAAGVPPVTSAASLEDALAGRRTAATTLTPPPPALAPLVEALRARADTAAGLARRVGLSLPAVMGLLLEAELEGWVRRTADSHYEVQRAH